MHRRIRRQQITAAPTTARPPEPGPVRRAPSRFVVGRADDPAERDADRLAAELVARVARPVAPSGSEASGATPIRRSATGSGGGDALDTRTAGRIRRASGGGRPLDDGIRRDFEPSIGSLDHVRVHTGAEAATISRQLDARAFTVGSDVFFGDGEYRPATSDGRRLIAHEVAHTALEGGGAPIRRALSVDNTTWSDAKSMTVSDGSNATGVFFLKDRAGKTLVVKGAHGTERLDLANQIVGAVGVEGVKQRMISLDSKEGAKMLRVMKSLAKKAPVDAQGYNPVLSKYNRLAQREFTAVQVMEAYENLGTLGALVQSSDVDQLLASMMKSGYFRQLGRLHAADVYMGNEDRMAHSGVPAIKNMFVNLKTGQLVSLDLELNFHDFDKVTKQQDKRGGADHAGNAPSLKGHEYTDFVNFVIDGSDSKRKWKDGTKTKTGSAGQRGGQQIVGSVQDATDPAKAAGLFDQLRNFLEYEANKYSAKHPVASDKALQAFDWATAKKQFMQGVELGNRSLVGKGESFAAMMEARAAAGAGDPLADATAIRVRTMYLKLRQMGYTDHDEIKAILVEYAKHLVAGGTEASFLSKVRQAALASGGKGATAIMPALPSAPRSTKVGAKTPASSKT